MSFALCHSLSVILSHAFSHFTTSFHTPLPHRTAHHCASAGAFGRRHGGTGWLGAVEVLGSWGLDLINCVFCETRTSVESVGSWVGGVGSVVDTEREKDNGNIGTCHGIMAWIMVNHGESWHESIWIMACAKWMPCMPCFVWKFIDVKVIHGYSRCFGVFVGLEPANSASSLCVNSSASTIWDHQFSTRFLSSSYCQGPCTPSWNRYGCILHCWQLGRLAQKRHSRWWWHESAETPERLRPWIHGRYRHHWIQWSTRHMKLGRFGRKDRWGWFGKQMKVRAEMVWALASKPVEAHHRLWMYNELLCHRGRKGSLSRSNHFAWMTHTQISAVVSCPGAFQLYWTQEPLAVFQLQARFDTRWNWHFYAFSEERASVSQCQPVHFLCKSAVFQDVPSVPWPIRISKKSARKSADPQFLSRFFLGFFWWLGQARPVVFSGNVVAGCPDIGVLMRPETCEAVEQDTFWPTVLLGRDMTRHVARNGRIVLLYIDFQ